jgi:hypothetical protein
LKKAKPQDAPQGVIAREQTDARSESRSQGAVSPFVAIVSAVATVSAFKHRFEAGLTTRWRNLEYKAALTCDPSTPLGEKRSALNGFFEDAEEAILTVVHEYFPKLLQVATAKRQYLGNESPLAWTKAQVLRQVCTFLGVDETFDSTSAPRDDSRLVAAAAQIALGIGWPGEIPSDFVLPGWLSTRWAWRLATGAPITEDDPESLAPLSRTETLEWIKDREHSIRRRLERQIELEEWDGIIEAGKTNVSVLDVFVAEPPSPTSEADGELQQSGPDHRELLVRPLLEERGWSTLDWALHSSVDVKTAKHYLQGMKSCASTRKKLAVSLGIEVNKLPK